MRSRNFKRRIHLGLMVIIILTISSIMVYLMPRTGTFQYEYQKGLAWRYETLYAPFNFPIYKTDAEINTDKEHVLSENSPFFILNENIWNTQKNKFGNAINHFKTSKTKEVIENIKHFLQNIYQSGIIQLPEEYSMNQVKSIRIIKNNIAFDVDIQKVYTLKKAYTTLTSFIEQCALSDNLKREILAINLDTYLVPNLEFDATKTNIELQKQLHNISQTQGMVKNGDLIISKRELITPEKIQILNSLKKEYYHNYGGMEGQLRLIGGQIILILVVVGIFSTFLYYTKKKHFFNFTSFIFMYSSLLATVSMAALGYYRDINMLVLPVLFLVIITNILLDKYAAMYLLVAASLLTSYFSPNSYMFLFMQLIAGVASIFSLSHLERRGQLFIALFLIFLSYASVYSAFILIREGDINSSHLLGFGWIALNCILLSLTYPTLYIFEKIFGYVSNITLIELANPCHPILRTLTQKAPGTFQHSLMVANLAEEVVYHIGGNPLLTRTAALYHDIGKSENPLYFVENQSGGVNPHSKLSFVESAKIIIEHVAKGVVLAKKNNLPESIIAIIRSHHGKSKVKYFYNSQRNKYPDDVIDESLFTYPGPDPMTKECAIIMMADAVEAASRSLTNKSEENMHTLVANIIDNQVLEGRFKNVDLSFKDIEVIKRIFTEMLVNIYHSRIAYPKLNVEETKP